jgi:hypothetical protein
MGELEYSCGCRWATGGAQTNACSKAHTGSAPVGAYLLDISKTCGSCKALTQKLESAQKDLEFQVADKGMILDQKQIVEKERDAALLQKSALRAAMVEALMNPHRWSEALQTALNDSADNRFCTSEHPGQSDPGDWRCELRAGHAGDHKKTNAVGLAVTWGTEKRIHDPEGPSTTERCEIEVTLGYMSRMTREQRRELLSDAKALWCEGCGVDQPREGRRCQCQNDE